MNYPLWRCSCVASIDGFICIFGQEIPGQLAAREIIFCKIAKMRIHLSDAIASFRSHDFSSLAERYISRNIYASEKLINHITTFKDSDVRKDSEPLVDCLWKIYEACYEDAFPEPLLHHWNFKYNEGYKKFIELQKSTSISNDVGL